MEYVRTILRHKKTSGSNPIPDDVKFGEPLVNLYDGIMLFSGAPNGIFQSSIEQPGVFEVGSTVSVLKSLSGINVNNLFAITGSTGQIIKYAGQTDLSGKILSGTSSGFILAEFNGLSDDDYFKITGGTINGNLFVNGNVFNTGTTTSANFEDVYTSITINYNSENILTSVTSNALSEVNKQTEFIYDSANTMTQVVTYFNLQTKTIDIFYDSLGQITGITKTII